MTTLQKIVKKAKEIRKAHPKKYAKWTDYVKAASKQIKPVKKAAPEKKIGAVKRVATKKCDHKDTNSHNVNVRVVSGIKPSKETIENWSLIKRFADIANSLGYYKVSLNKRSQEMWIDETARANKILAKINRNLITDYNQKRYFDNALASFKYWKA
jgi:hypothetical protein